MVRKKQDGPELKLSQIDTLRYLTSQNIKQGIFDLTEFVKKGGARFSQQKQIPVGKVFEFFCKNNHGMVGISNDVKIGSAYDTWLRKSGLLNSQNNKYELSDIGISLQSSSLSMQSYCFLLISKQWLIITDDERNKIYGRNLLCVLIELFKKKNSIKKDSFVTTIGEEGIRLYRKQYEGIKLANLEGARYLEDPLKISCIIEEKNGYYQLTESFTKIADDYLSKEGKIRPPSTLKLLDDRYECYLNQLRFGFYDLIDKNNINLYMKTYPDLFQMTYQKIYFGAPGTGKSHKIDYNLFKDKDGNLIGKGIKEIPEDRKFRTTFHPDYDYAQFVGAYKPKKELNKTTNKEELTYSFIPQVFAKAYAAAWKQYFAAGNASTANNQVYLVIEEINRGNCAQIFGDIFQLLDRDSEGFSQYSIDADCDFAEWLKTNDNGLKSVWPAYEKKVGDGKLKLPPNLNILATMNTSDQSLFPMDSAFKRRFDWEYVPISFTDEEGNEKEAAKYEIDIPDANGKNYLWKNFVEAVNDKILDLTESEDKQLGEFFIKPDSGNIISKERFLGKVIFYLWNEVCKDEHKNGSFFRAKINDKEDFFTFQDLYKKKDLLKLFLDELLKEEG